MRKEIRKEIREKIKKEMKQENRTEFEVRTDLAVVVRTATLYSMIK